MKASYHSRGPSLKIAFPGLFSLRVLENRPITPDCWLLKLKSRDISHHAKPGQFLMIRVSPNPDPLLPRPFSLCRIHPEKNSVSIIYKMSGPGTSWLSTRKTGESLPVLGPLGHPFTVPKGAKNIALVGGGIGVTPLISLGEALSKQKKRVSFFLGLRTRQAITVTPALLWFVPKARRHISTDDGTFGKKGHIVDFLESFLKKNRVDYIAACGPKPMLEALQPLAGSRGIPTEVAVEQSMACGLGYCQGCAVWVKENGKPKPILACKDGPVVLLDKLVL